ncbi:PH domain-containing protein [Psychrobacillus sp. NPDC058041]|uniref:PH domain-containing protein n=1 Tax=Psychrobacillus sp. NPDC058041 TaxID=3346310 RepID=UPI0036DBA955
MTFKSKRDRTFIILIMVASVLIALATLLPVVVELFIMEAPDMKAVWITSVIFLLCEGFILWVSLDIVYTFKENSLIVRGGLFRSNIPFEDITKVNPTSNILVGYRILSSKDALEIHYKKATMGSVIISPENQEVFLEILLEKAPHIHIVK